MKRKIKDKINTFLCAISVLLLILLLLVGSYKWQEFKLKHIWGIENPSFFQVWDSMGNNKNK